ncbi:hypothetical protein HYH02_013833 [Chlamydomonas schloesseri]|uniref:Formamidopyrimidine-DNA glycosylase H2TH DNA-binding domain-containing protein n=1 Tax=Chlamydomonas schloesseri TaxID=2026947 RepID=A0A835T059_9CHLO|nr:hypothetical protein HYH02_013833 [Chlamydomonas schloesseri]|eukprot:KAG2430005.1 hypothetical protein HYH02_013833 [Chlamydomonas schloesseri]
MVEGHQCHRVAAAHRKLLVGKSFQARSPNGRFKEGAAAINAKPLMRIEVHGKNLFYFFGGGDIPQNQQQQQPLQPEVVGTPVAAVAAAAAAAATTAATPDAPRRPSRAAAAAAAAAGEPAPAAASAAKGKGKGKRGLAAKEGAEEAAAVAAAVAEEEGGGDVVVMHVHFGMSGAFRTMELPGLPPTDTTRLELLHKGAGLVAHLSAMTVAHGGPAFYVTKAAALGQDPLREDADKEVLWAKVQKSKKPIGLVLMDQTLIAGVGNIYRAEILYKARVHPEAPAASISREQFDRIWWPISAGAIMGARAQP